MKNIFLVLILLSSLIGRSQSLKVFISEEKKGKRVTLMAENRTRDTLNVFLTVNAEGYRRSSSKPVVRNIPPLSKVPMITLIELADANPWYTFDMLVNDPDREEQISIDSPEQDMERIAKGKIIIFTTNGCEKCDRLVEELTTRHIQHQTFNIIEDPVVYGQFMSYIERRLTEDTKIRFPLIWNRDDVYFGYQEIEEVLLKIGN